MSSKRCSVCAEVKPLGAFNRHRRQRDGYQPQCRACSKAGKVAWRQDNADRVKTYEAARRNTEKQLARRKLRQAVTRGDIEKPGHCVACGITCVPHGHHTDYSKPLAVVWLCRACHEREHPEIRVGKRNITP